jgi:hypothetical protein
VTMLLLILQHPVMALKRDKRSHIGS